MKIKTTLITSLLCTISFPHAHAQQNITLQLGEQIAYENLIKVRALPSSPDLYKQTFFDLQRSNLLNNEFNYELLKLEARRNHLHQKHTIGIILNDNIVDNSNQTHRLALASIFNRTLKSKINTFVIKDEWIHNSTNKDIRSIEIWNPHDEVWLFMLNDIGTTIQFTDSGKQNAQIRLTYTDTSSEILNFDVTINVQNNLRNAQEIQHITASRTYQGYGESTAIAGQAEYEIFLDNIDGILDKPVFLVDGFDPGDTRGINDIYNILAQNSYENFAQTLQDAGFDIVVVNFPTYEVNGNVIDGGADFIQRNAYTLAEIIEEINSQKQGDFDNIVIGPSMGGLISRYALKYLENQNIDHQTGLYVSFDSPHLGANVPIGFQHLFNYVAYGPAGNTMIQEVVDGMLRSNAAKQMLLDHLDGRLQNNSATEFSTSQLLPIGAPNFRNEFQQELNALGFPEQSRNISISNGAGNGTTNGTPGQYVLNNYTLPLTETQRAIINLKFTPAAGQTNQLVSQIQVQQYLFVWFTLLTSTANASSTVQQSGYDAAPGGTFDMNGFTGELEGNDMIEGVLENLQIDRFCFIPAHSSMATSSNNWYSNIATNHPFDAQYIPNINEPHITLNEGNIEFLRNEIFNVLNTSTSVFESMYVQNPIENQLMIFSNQAMDAQLSIIDMTGKKVWSINTTLQNSHNFFSPQLGKGMYILNVETDNQKTSFKIIK